MQILFGILNVALLGLLIFGAFSFKRKFILYSTIGIMASNVLSNIIYLFTDTYTNPFSTIVNTLLSLLPFLAITFITYCKIYKKDIAFPKHTRFIPAILLICSNFLSNIATSIIHNLSESNTTVGVNVLSSIISSILPAFLLVLLTSRILSEPKPKKEIPNGEYIDLFKHILLLIFTFGIYYLVWIYKTTIYTNNCHNEEYRNPTNKLLLCIFVPFYSIYWVYKTAQRIDKLAKQIGTSSDIATISLILALFVPIVAPIIMQSKINELLKPATHKVAQEPATSTNTTAQNTSSVADELLKFKNLLDQGAITQEEYDKKKTELLNL
ncbi:MAG: DUF4234 domain-containing protein [Clostridia bacterium]|nr:DUF4234 domain-containing protein [Clostridia bacterium]